MKGTLEISKAELCRAIQAMFLNYGVVDPEKTDLYLWMDGKLDFTFETKPIPEIQPPLGGLTNSINSNGGQNAAAQQAQNFDIEIIEAQRPD